MTSEITKEAFKAIIHDEAEAFRDSETHELYEKQTFVARGCLLITIFNFTSNVKQYYIQDINA